MPRPFQELTLEQFVDMLYVFPFKRRINGVHMHHTWRPNHGDFGKREPLKCIDSMWEFHVKQRGFVDIAQHITIDPRGKIWTGRNWNVAPASATGNNGNAEAGPFMFEMIGDFDKGRDAFEGPQRDTALRVVAAVQHRFGLMPESLRFHNQMAAKSCPGTAIDYASIVEEVRALQAELMVGDGKRQLSSFGTEATELRAASRKIVEMLASDAGLAQPSKDEELEDEWMGAAAAELSSGDVAAAARASGTRDLRAALTAADKETLRKHVINLRLGAFSEGGEFSTSEADVDRIFGELLPAEIATQKAQGKKLKLTFYAHGGLNAERPSLDAALGRLAFWRNNGVYPIFFVWETGLWETVTDIVKGFVSGRRDTARLDVSGFTDPILEAVSRQAGMLMWNQMKRSAELGTLHGGGPLAVARKTAELWAAHSASMEIHAVGHSAGSIFHAYFLPTLLGQRTGTGVPPLHIQTLHFLAPACTTDLFKTRLKDLIGADKSIHNFAMYTMRREFELNDKAGPYRKSLLYLVSRAFESAQPTPILGLEESVRQDARLLKFFGLAGESGKGGDLLFSPTGEGAGPREGTRSITHGDFDNDLLTMNSVARRIMGAKDDESIFSFVEETRSIAAETLFSPPQVEPQAEVPVAAAVPNLNGAGSGHRRALCVGINAYASPNELNGCVNDAETWAKALAGLGYETAILRDAQATRNGILDALRLMISQARTGDSLVFQFAGHGTQVTDVDGDDGDGKDEALCPVDLHTGALIIDDDLRELFFTIPEGVSFTCFMDCCHSGTITRLAQPFGAGASPGKARFIPEKPELNAAHAKYRAALGRKTVPPADAASMRWVLFSACLSHQVAYENNGSGDFTRFAMSILSRGTALSNEQFEAMVREAFGAQARQWPELDCAPAYRSQPLLGRARSSRAGANGMAADLTTLLTRLTEIEARLQRLGV